MPEADTLGARAGRNGEPVHQAKGSCEGCRDETEIDGTGCGVLVPAVPPPAPQHIAAHGHTKGTDGECDHHLMDRVACKLSATFHASTGASFVPASSSRGSAQRGGAWPRAPHSASADISSATAGVWRPLWA